MIHDLEVLGLLIPLQYRRLSSTREILHRYPTALHPLQEFLVRDADDPERIRLTARSQANSVSAHIGFNRIRPLGQQVVVVLDGKPNAVSPPVAVLLYIHIAPVRAIRGGEGGDAVSVGIHNADLDAVAIILTRPAPDDSDAASGATGRRFIQGAGRVGINGRRRRVGRVRWRRRINRLSPWDKVHDQPIDSPCRPFLSSHLYKMQPYADTRGNSEIVVGAAVIVGRNLAAIRPIERADRVDIACGTHIQRPDSVTSNT